MAAVLYWFPDCELRGWSHTPGQSPSVTDGASLTEGEPVS